MTRTSTTSTRKRTLNRERVLQAAVVMLAGGDLGRLDRQLQEARIDWRDVLVVAGLSLAGIWYAEDRGRLVAGLGAVFVASLALFHLLTGTIALAGHVDQVTESGGAIGAVIAFPLRRTIGFWGALLVLLAALGLGTLIVTRASIRDVAGAIRAFVQDFKRWVGFGAGDPAGRRPNRSAGPVAA